MEIIPPSNSFTSLIQHQRKGAMLADLSAEMQKAVLAAREHMAPAKLVLTINICPADREGALAVTDDITLKLPKAKKPTSIFFATDEGTLSRTNPNQQELELKVASTSNIDRSPNLETQNPAIKIA